MRVKLKRLSENAVIPSKAYDGDFCYDVTASSMEYISKNVIKYGIGWAMEIVRDDVQIGSKTERVSLPILGSDFESETSYDISVPIDRLNIDIDVRPRSSIYKTGLVLCNSVGTVDEKYRNEICLFFRVVDDTLPIYNIGDKIGQIKIGFTVPIEFIEVGDLTHEEGRGMKGFGSSDAEVVTKSIDGVEHQFTIKKGWILNPNEKVVRGILKGLAKNDGLCPCKHPDNDGSLVCPCDSYMLRDKCCCNLYLFPNQN